MATLRPGQIADGVLVAFLVVSAQVQVWSSPAWDGGRPVHAVLLLLTTAPLALRRQRPFAVVLVVDLAAWFQYELGGGAPHPWFALLLALYAVAAHAPRTQAIAGAAAAAALVLAADIPGCRRATRSTRSCPHGVWSRACGYSVAGCARRRNETQVLALRAESAERMREEAAARAVADERARIARELHDLVAHSLGVVVIQAQAGTRSLDTDPAAARTALEAIERVSRQGLREMRRLLGLLTGDDASGLTPQPGLDQLDELVGQVRATGLAGRAGCARQHRERPGRGRAGRLPHRPGGARPTSSSTPPPHRSGPSSRIDDRRVDLEVGRRRHRASLACSTAAAATWGCANALRCTAERCTSEALEPGGFRVSAVLPLNEVPA